MAKINKKKLEKALNILVLLVAIPCFVSGVSFALRGDDIHKDYVEMINRCSEWYPNYDYNYDRCVSISDSFINNLSRETNTRLIIGIGFPIVYFGGKKFIKYLTTEDKKEER